MKNNLLIDEENSNLANNVKEIFSRIAKVRYLQSERGEVVSLRSKCGVSFSQSEFAALNEAGMKGISCHIDNNDVLVYVSF